MISVIIPTYNNDDELIKTVSNVCSQSYKDIEIIIIDDGSSNKTKDKILKLKNSRIKYYKNPTNLGVSKSRIEGVRKSKGEYIAFIDDDDVWLDEKLSKQSHIIKKKNLDFVTSNFIINNMIDQTKYEKKLNNLEDNFQYSIIREPGPFFQCCLFATPFLDKHINKLDSSAEPSEDWDFFISISKENPRMENLEENLFQWNLSKKSQSSNDYNEASAIEYIVSKHKEYIIQNSNKRIMATHYRKIGSMFFYANEYNKAKEFYNHAIKCDFLSFKNILFKIVYSLPKSIASKIIYKYTSQIK